MSEAPPSEGHWATIAAEARTLHGAPDSTIKPRGQPLGETGRAILASFSGLMPETPLGEAPRLELGPVIGEGGMGIVRLATQTTMAREVAVKALRPARRAPGPTLELLQEAWTAGRLEHPNIVPIYDIALDDEGSPLIMLKRIEGESWSTLIGDRARAREHFGFDDVLEGHLRVLISVCNAIHFAHDRRIVHLDLKPENVMTGHHGEVYVVDWGIAMALDDDGSGRVPLASARANIVGTPHYMAPEMLEPRGKVIDERTDVYLLGAMLYELLSGRPPHQGETLMEVLHAAVMTDPAQPDDAPSELAQICRVAMARAPEDRYESAEALRRALQAFLRHRESATLAERAAEDFVSLERMLAQAKVEPVARQALFAQIRFGYEQALASWSDNTRARDGLAAAVHLMVEYELDHGDPQVGAAIAREAPHLPGSLRARVDQAVARREAGLDELERLRRDKDRGIGERTRVFVVGMFGSAWSVIPLIQHFVDPRPDLASTLGVFALIPALSLLILGGLAWWARDSLSRTRLNRVVTASLFLALLGHLALLGGAALLGLEAVLVMVMLPLMWSLVVAMVALSVDRRVAPIAVSYVLGFFAAAAWPEWAFLINAASNLVLLVVVSIIWWPQRIRGPIAEPDLRA